MQIPSSVLGSVGISQLQVGALDSYKSDLGARPELSTRGRAISMCRLTSLSVISEVTLRFEILRLVVTSQAVDGVLQCMTVEQSDRVVCVRVYCL